ncbi:hypothetical protein ACFLYP_01790 [Chloroflexota bacterium]
MDLLIILLIGLTTRLIFIISVSTDQDFHLWAIKERKKFGNLKQNDVQNSVIPGYRGYPPIPHFIVSQFPEKYWIIAGKFINISYDLISIVIVYYMTTYIFNIQLKSNIQNLDMIPNYVTLLYATSPILHPVSARLKAIGGRTISNLLNLGYFLGLGYALLQGNILFLFLCVPIGWAIILSSYFGMQYMLLTSILLSIFYFDPIPFLLVTVVFASGLFLPGMDIKKHLHRKIDHYIWYVRNQHKWHGTAGRNNLRHILLLPYYLVKDPNFFLSQIFKNITPIIIAYSLPPIVLLLFWCFRLPEGITIFFENEVIHFLTIMSLSSLIVFSLTSLKPFIFLGQAERYLGYSAGFIYILFIYFIMKFDISTMIILQTLIFQISMILINFMYLQISDLKKNLSWKETDAFSSLIAFLRSRQQLRLLAIPTKWNFKIAFQLSNTDAMFYFDNITNERKLDGIRYMDEEHVVLHYVNSDFDFFSKKYNINTLAIQKAALSNANKFGIDYDFSDRIKIFENEDFLVFEICQQSKRG